MSQKAVDGDSLTEFSESTSLHGLKNAVQKGPFFGRVFWRVTLLISSGTLIFFLIGIFSKIAEPSLMTETRVSFAEADGVPFPSVTICNSNQVRRSFVRENPLIKFLFLEWFLYNQTDSALRSIIIDGENFTEWSTMPNFTDANETLFRELLLDSAQPLEQFIYFGKFGDYEFRADAINANFRRMLTDMGVCYTFKGHSKNLRRLVQDSGSDHGLQFHATLGSSDYYLSPINNYKEGITIAVHMEEEAPSMLTRGIQLQPKADVRVAITRRRFIYDEWGTQCLNTQSDDFVNPLHPTSYTEDACMLKCKRDFIYNQCDCLMFFESGNRHVCLTNEEYNCRNVANYLFSTHKDGRKKCSCPKPCVEFGFEETISSSKYVSPYVDEIYRQYTSMTTSEIEAQIIERQRQLLADTIAVSIYFKDLTLTTTRQIQSYSFRDAWGDIGGCLGLCFGASIFTVLELGVFCMTYAIKLVHGLSKRFTSVPSHPSKKTPT